MSPEDRVYEARGFRRRASVAVILCIFGLLAYAAFLGYRHHHPGSTEPMKVERIHLGCPHSECKTGHEAFERPTEWAPPLLGALLLVYCAAVGIGAFVVEVPR